MSPVADEGQGTAAEAGGQGTVDEAGGHEAVDQRRRALSIALPAFVAGKTLSVLVTILTVYSTSTTARFPSRGELEDAFGRWDAVNYLHIAADGYPAGPLDTTPGAAGHFWGFFPGLPFLVHVVGLVVRDLVLSGLVVTSVAELLALWWLARLLLLERGGDTARASLCVWLLALHPYGIFLTAVYTEAPFLAATLAAIYLARTGRNAAATCAAGVATAIRITGVAVVLAIAVEAVRRRRRRAIPDVAVASLALLPLGAFMLDARRQTGDALAYFDIVASASFNRHLASPWTGLVGTWRAATAAESAASSDYIFAMEVLFGVAMFAVLVVATAQHVLGVPWVRRRLAMQGSPARPSVPLMLLAYGILAWTLAAAQPYWLSMPRYSITFVPAYLLVADLVGRRPGWSWPLVTVSGGLLAFTTTIFASGRFLA